MPRPPELIFLTINEASKLIQEGSISPTELVEAHLEWIELTDSSLNSFITLLHDESLKAAIEAENEIKNGDYRGPLHGIPIGLKDLYSTKGIRTTVGSKIMEDWVPDYDAGVVEKFIESGSILMGKLQMHEFAYGPTSENVHYGPAHNPWDTSRVTGGSSGGSGSAVASGQCMLALGTDTGGSVRIPSALCGIVGLKPTFGLVSRYGVFPLSYSLDTVGPITRTVRDNALVMNSIVGHDSRDPSSSFGPFLDYTSLLDKDVSGIRLAVPREHFFDLVDFEVKQSFDQALSVLENIGMEIDEVSIPMLNEVTSIATAITAVEGVEVHLSNLRDRYEDYDPQVRDRLELGLFITGPQYVTAQRARVALSNQIEQVLCTYDAIVTPTIPVSAPKIGQTLVDIRGSLVKRVDVLPRLTRPFNLFGGPSITIPCGSDSNNLPIGLQISGKHFEDAMVLQIANAFENATSWHQRHPKL